MLSILAAGKSQELCSVVAFHLPLTDWLQLDCPQIIPMDHAQSFQGMPMAALSLGLAQPL